MADILSPPSYVKFKDVELDTEKPIVTSLFNKLGGQTNKLIDDIEFSIGLIETLNVYVRLSGTYSSTYDSVANRTYITFPAIINTRFLCNIIYIKDTSVDSWNTYAKRLERLVTTSTSLISTVIDSYFHTSYPNIDNNSFPFVTAENPSTTNRTLLHFDPIDPVADYVSTSYRISWAGDFPSTLAAEGLIQSI